MPFGRTQHDDAFASQLLEDLPCGILVTDPQGKLTYVNAAFARWIGLPAAEICDGYTLPALLTKPGRLFYETHLSPMLRLQGFVREISCMLDVPGGDPWPVLLNGIARLDAAGEPSRHDFTIFDARERHMYEAELLQARMEADELASIVRTSPNAILRVDSEGRIKRWNRGAERLMGLTETDAIGRHVETVIETAEAPDWFETAKAAAQQDREAVFERSLSSGIELEITVARITRRQRARGVPDWSIVLRDISERKRADRNVRIMVDEMKHRVKNTLGVVSGIARQTLSREDGSAFIARLLALSKAHDILTAADFEGADLKDLLSVAAQEAGGAQRFHFDAPSVLLTQRQATSLSMALHEMNTNALKYGALSSAGGHVAVICNLIGGPESYRLVLNWTEFGGPPVKPPSRDGFGTKMIKKVLAAELGAEVTSEFPPDGCRHQIAFALNRSQLARS